MPNTFCVQGVASPGLLRTFFFKCFVCVALFCPLLPCLCVCPPLLWFLSLSFLPPLPPRLVFVLWSSLHPGALVPPGHLVAAVTALLPCFHAGSVVKLCYSSVIRFMATKATSPVWGFYPLHHVTSDVGSLVRPRNDDPGPY